MADSKITALTALTAADPANDMIPIVDVSDTPPASGNTKRISINNILAASGTATLASATITGALTVDTTTLVVNPAGYPDRVGIGTATPVNTLEVVAPAGDNIVSTFRSGDATAANNAGGGFRSISSATAANRVAQVWLDADGANFSGGDYFFIQKNGGSGTVEFNQSSNAAMVFLTNSTERARIDSSGNVGIGVAPSAWNTVKALQISNGSFYGAATDTAIQQNAFYQSGWKYVANGFASQVIMDGASIKFQNATNNTLGAGAALTWNPAMTLDASGNLGIGVAANPNTRVHVKGSSSGADYCVYSQNSSSTFLFGVRNDGLFVVPSDATLTQAPYNLTTGSAANLTIDSSGILYRSTSSLKYKSDIADSTRGLADVLKLRPVTYKAKNSGDTVFGGLIAEEVDAAGLTEFVQYAPDKTPDAIHYGNMVSLLVAAIKELTARVQTLETR